MAGTGMEMSVAAVDEDNHAAIAPVTCTSDRPALAAG